MGLRLATRDPALMPHDWRFLYSFLLYFPGSFFCVSFCFISEPKNEAITEHVWHTHVDSSIG